MLRRTGHAQQKDCRFHGTTTAQTLITRANLSRQLPTAMSIVSPNILYRLCEYAITCRGIHGQSVLLYLYVISTRKTTLTGGKMLKCNTQTHLRVSSADVKHCGVVGLCDEPAHLNVSDAVVDPQQRGPPKLRDCTGHECHRHQRGPHPGAWRV